MEILITNRQDKIAVSAEMEDLLVRVVKHVLETEGVEDDPEVSLVLVDDAEIAEMNLNYRGIDQPTDVLSFAMDEQSGDGVEFIQPEEEHLLGDVVISLETAARQAEEYQHSFERELGFLTVHGVLHLLGYDHFDASSETDMRAREEKILTSLGLLR